MRSRFLIKREGQIKMKDHTFTFSHTTGWSVIRSPFSEDPTVELTEDLKRPKAMAHHRRGLHLW